MEFADNFKKYFNFYFQVALVFSFILGIGYLLGFWWTANVNIFPFLSLFDLLKFSACPFLILFVPWLLLQWAVVEWQVFPRIENYAEKLTSVVRNNSRRWVRGIILLVSVAYFIFLIILGVLLKFTTLFIGIPIASLIVMAWLLNTQRKTDKEPEKINFHRFGRVLLMLCLLPFISYDYGRHKVNVILKGKKYSYVWVNEGENKTLYKFLGFINGHYFFIEKNNQILLINNNIDRLELHHFLKKGEKDSPDVGFT